MKKYTVYNLLVNKYWAELNSQPVLAVDGNPPGIITEKQIVGHWNKLSTMKDVIEFCRKSLKFEIVREDIEVYKPSKRKIRL